MRPLSPWAPHFLSDLTVAAAHCSKDLPSCVDLVSLEAGLPVQNISMEILTPAFLQATKQLFLLAGEKEVRADRLPIDVFRVRLLVSLLFFVSEICRDSLAPILGVPHTPEQAERLKMCNASTDGLKHLV